jgi:hypothetical protein
VPPRSPSKADPFEREIEAALQPGHFVRHAAVWPFVEGLEQVEATIAKLVRGSPARAAALYEIFLAGCYEKAGEIDDSGGHFGMFVGGLFRGWVKARQADGADPDETARHLYACMEAQHHRKIGSAAGFEEVVAGVGPGARPTFLERAEARSGTGSGG